jgi:hypothetical protein
VNKYLPPRARRAGGQQSAQVPAETLDQQQLPPLLRWLDRALSR